MTLDDAINILKQYVDYDNPDVPDFYTMEEAIKVIIKALEQEPCEDAISRQAVMDCFKKWQPYMATRLWDFEQELSALPSVQPQEPKTGHWIDNKARTNLCNCSECGALSKAYSKYCPNCGAKMKEGD